MSDVYNPILKITRRQWETLTTDPSLIIQLEQLVTIVNELQVTVEDHETRITALEP